MIVQKFPGYCSMGSIEVEYLIIKCNIRRRLDKRGLIVIYIIIKTEILNGFTTDCLPCLMTVRVPTSLALTCSPLPVGAKH